ncbi:MaoC family dehydratase [Sporosarcina pasteurii]|uniref:FAS1-like dehydratase domain-containing protein n=1 Tax=Sporosarcina pasteurii TaxID=1474 RepID=A0A380CES6_SPOPA|nr:MaoC family dehydratase [Sporosarcina pasteurii]MDS9473230.1 MaoC family dehydratase [Sporosarcina pasteurii]SUJ17935.1 Uncharacterised protein [Sporosarcina pasteurii]
MKTSTESIVFTKEDVLQYCEAIGEENKLYTCGDYAKSHGFQTIPLPSTMPLIMYRLFTIPWEHDGGVMIHRKQECSTFRRMFIDEEYTGDITLTNVVSRKSYTFREETLSIYDKSGELCFQGTSHLVVGDTT